jgi:hypothetical protein
MEANMEPQGNDPRREVPRPRSSSERKTPMRYRLTNSQRDFQIDKGWKAAGVLSLVLNVLLLVGLIVIGRSQQRSTESLDTLVGNLRDGFSTLLSADLTAQVDINQEIPVELDLPLQRDTVVILTEQTSVEGALITIQTTNFQVYNAPAVVVLPPGTRLPVALDVSVPLRTTIPIELEVPVRFSIETSDLGPAFEALMEELDAFGDAMP